MPESTRKRFFNACSTGKCDVVASYLDTGTDPDLRDEYGLTGLMWAGRKGQLAVAQLLLERGASIDLGDNRGRTAPFHAVGYKRYDIVRWLAHAGADINVVDTHGWTPLDFSCTSRHLKMVDLIESLGGTPKYSVNWKR
jgi:ankyrin repeat protein